MWFYSNIITLKDKSILVVVKVYYFPSNRIGMYFGDNNDFMNILHHFQIRLMRFYFQLFYFDFLYILLTYCWYQPESLV